MDKILVTGAINPANNICEELVKRGFEVDFVADELKELDIDVSGYAGVICNSLFMHNDIDRFKALRFIQLTSAGLDRAPVERIKESGITLYSARGVYSVPMAEWAVCSVLSLYKNFNHFYKAQESHNWSKYREVRELDGSKALVVGLGSVGIEVAKRLDAMGVEVSGVDIVSVESQYIDRCYSISELKSVIADYDIVILTLPLTADTRHLFDGSHFNVMRDGAVLVNISRGGVVNQDDLVEALKTGKLWGAALDVFETEPLDSESPLWDMERVLITPHNSFVSNRNRERLERLIIENITTYYE